MTTSLPKNKNIKTVKFMQTLLESQWNQIQDLAEEKGVTVQEYIRIFIVSEYLKSHPSEYTDKKMKFHTRVKKGWETRRKKVEDAEIQAKKDAFPQ